LADSYFGAFYIALATAWKRKVLLNAHSKYLGSCSMPIQNMAGAALFDHIGAKSNTKGLHDVSRAAPAIF
jgi:hypothetical protein